MSGLEPPVPSAVAADVGTSDVQHDESSVQSARPSNVRSRPSLGSWPSDTRPPHSGKIWRYGGMARRTLGILLLLVTVVLWTTSSFLASSIFADDTYSKPFAVTYVNVSFFAFALIPILLKRDGDDGLYALVRRIRTMWANRSAQYSQVAGEEGQEHVKPDDDDEEEEVVYLNGGASNRLQTVDNLPSSASASAQQNSSHGKLDMYDTAKLSFEFCILWFAANYSAAACLKYTTVASSTILTSTSSIWTLLFGTIIKVERFTVRKLIGVLASLAGIVLISSVDLTGENDENRGSFPHKSHKEIAIGDALAILSAVVYGAYTILMKKRIGDEARVSMPLFFGLVGLFNVILLWPGFIIVNYLGDEPFELPPTGRIWAVVLINSTTSLFSDVCWAYAMLLTSPLVVTVGLSLTIPLSLIGQMILQSQFSSPAYWIGAGIVFVSFIFINHESKEDEAQECPDSGDDPPTIPLSHEHRLSH